MLSPGLTHCAPGTEWAFLLDCCGVAMVAERTETALPDFIKLTVSAERTNSITMLISIAAITLQRRT